MSTKKQQRKKKRYTGMSIVAVAILTAIPSATAQNEGTLFDPNVGSAFAETGILLILIVMFGFLIFKLLKGKK